MKTLLLISHSLGFRERFLVWNHIGVVTLFETEDQNDSRSASIEVEFHDTTMHHGIRLDGQGFTMADLNATALMLASPVSHSPIKSP